MRKKLGHQFCRARPPNMVISVRRGYKLNLNKRYHQDIGGEGLSHLSYEEWMKFNTSQVREFCQSLKAKPLRLISTDPDLKAKAKMDHKRLRCKGRFRGWLSKHNLIKNIMEMQDPYVSPSHPFGKCFQDSDCKYIPHTACQCVHPFKTQWDCRYRCACAPGFCHELAAETQNEQCIPDLPANRIERLIKGLQTWSARRGLQIGGLGASLEDMSGHYVTGESGDQEYKQIQKVLKQQIRARARAFKPAKSNVSRPSSLS